MTHTWTQRTLALPTAALLVVLTALAISPGGTAAQAPTPPPVPVITKVSPKVAEPGDTIRISGRSFVEIRAVSMAGIALKYKLKNRRHIEAKAPAYAVRGTVVVATGGGVATSPRAIVIRPRLTVSPQRVAILGSTTATGSGFIPAEPVDLYVGRAAVASTGATAAGTLPPTEVTIPDRSVPGRTIIRARGQFSGVPVAVAVDVGVDWPQRGISPDGNRHNRAERNVGVTATPSLTLDWVADVIGPSRSAPTVVNGQVYVASDTGAVLAIPIDCAAGGESCKVAALGIAGGGVESSPVIVDDVAYVGSEDGRVYAFDTGCPTEARPCDPSWTGATGGPISGTPVVADGLVVVGSQDGSVYAFDAACAAAECEPVWVGPTGGPVLSSPAAHDGVIYAGSDDGFLYAFSATCAQGGGTCRPLWRGWTSGTVRSSPAVANGVVYVGSSDGRVRGFPVGCERDGSICYAIWRGVADGPVESSPVIADSYVVVGTMAGSVMGFPVACAERATGCLPSWTVATGGPVRSTAAVGGNALGGAVVFIGSDDGFVYGFPLNCRNVGNPGRCPATWASGTRAAISAAPTLVNGALYAASEDGTVRRWSLR